MQDRDPREMIYPQLRPNKYCLIFSTERETSIKKIQHFFSSLVAICDTFKREKEAFVEENEQRVVNKNAF